MLYHPSLNTILPAVRPTMACTIGRVLASQHYSTLVPRGALRPLKSRGLIKVSGKGTLNFLQGLCTQDISRVFGAKAEAPMEQSAAAAVFLSPKGRVLFDCLIWGIGAQLNRIGLIQFFIGTHGGADEELSYWVEYSGVSLKPDTSKGIVSDDKGEESLVVDVDEGVLDNVMRLFIRHRVHLPLNIEKLDNLGVYWTPSKSQNGCDGDTEVPVYEDPRVKDLGLRAILPKSDIDAESTEALYRRLRIGLVVPEGPNEMAPDKVLPLNYNLDLTNHIAFNKGCYIGQELTTRASKKLAVRKRLFGMRIDGDVDVESGAEIMCDGEKIGKVLELSSSEGDGDVLGIAQIHAPKGMQMNTKQAMVEATKKYLEDDHIYIEKDSTKIGVELGLPKYILS